MDLYGILPRVGWTLVHLTLFFSQIKIVLGAGFNPQKKCERTPLESLSLLILLSWQVPLAWLSQQKRPKTWANWWATGRLWFRLWMLLSAAEAASCQRREKQRHNPYPRIYNHIVMVCACVCARACVHFSDLHSSPVPRPRLQHHLTPSPPGVEG